MTCDDVVLTHLGQPADDESRTFWTFYHLTKQRVNDIGARFNGSYREAVDVIEDHLWPASQDGTRAVTDEMIERAWRSVQHRPSSTDGKVRP